jgi:hypothetical protein
MQQEHESKLKRTEAGPCGRQYLRMNYSKSPLEKLESAIGSLKKDYPEGAKPFLEADVVGYLYHKWLSENPEDSIKLHIGARVPGFKASEHPDIVFGEPGDVKGEQGTRPGIKEPELIVEVKSFPGFIGGQISNRKTRTGDDIKRLGQKRQIPGNPTKVVFAFDPGRCLSDRERDELHAMGSKYKPQVIFLT